MTDAPTTGSRRAGLRPGDARTPRLRVPAELALVGVSLAAVGAFTRLFSLHDRLWPLVVAVVAGHAVAVACRVTGRGLGVAALASTIGLALMLAWLFAPSTLRYGLPTPDTARYLSTELGEASTRFQDVVAPTAPTPGFLVASTIGLWVAVFLADWAAFRLTAPFEAVVPTTGLFIFAAVLGEESGRMETTAFLLVAVFGFLLLHRVARQETSARWLATDTGRGSRALLRAGALLAGVAVVGGLLVGYSLPGAHEPGLIAVNGRGDGPGSRVTLSPLVDIKARLIEQQAVEVFTVRSAVPSYWRLTALDSFDGQVWGSGGSFETVDGPLPNGATPARTSQEVEQVFNIEALAAIWLPAAFEPLSVDADGLDVRWEPSSATLIVDADRPTSDDTTYRVVSSIPTVTDTQLTTSASPPAEIREHYTALPEDFSPEAANLADEITTGAETPYQEALALQNYFRDNFTYSTAVPAGHGEDAIEAFLDPTGRRAGYCEQFAGTYAALARAAGLPSRVAVGFTPGQQDPSDPTLFRVRGEHAHAWPEVYLAGFGWIPFEPTPGRGAPGAEDYTGVPAEQASPLTSLTSVSPTTSSALTAPTTPAAGDPSAADTATDLGSNAGSGGTAWARRAATAGGLVLLAAVAYLILAIGAAWWRRWRRWRRAGQDPTARTRAAWDEAAEALADLGAVAEPSETHLEFAHRTVKRMEVAHERHLDLAEATTAAEYGSGGVDTVVADQAVADAEQVVSGARRRRTRAQRFRRLLDPRRKVRASSSRRNRSHQR